MTPSNPPEATPPESGDATPGKPKGTGSRQQTQPNQASQTGSEEFDKGQARDNDGLVNGAKPAGAK